MLKKNLSKGRAARILTDIAMKHLASYSPAGEKARVRAFSKKVATVKKIS
jgi:hypothetical protein